MIEEFLLGFLVGVLSMVHIFPHSKSFWETIYDYMKGRNE